MNDWYGIESKNLVAMNVEMLSKLLLKKSSSDWVNYDNIIFFMFFK